MNSGQDGAGNLQVAPISCLTTQPGGNKNHPTTLLNAQSSYLTTQTGIHPTLPLGLPQAWQMRACGQHTTSPADRIWQQALQQTVMLGAC